MLDIEPPKRYNYSYNDTSSHLQIKPNDNQRYTRNEVRKRQNKKRKLKNSVRNAIISFSIIVAVFAIGTVLSLTVFFNISAIEISGSGTYSEDEIKNICGVEIGENLFLINSDETAKKITQGLPYVYDVKIKKKLPVTLSIVISDAVPAYSIQSEEGTFILLDDNLKVLENSASERAVNTITITDAMVIGANPGHKVEFENKDISESIFQITEVIKKLEMNEATGISCIDKSNNYVVYNDRITFELGDCSNLENKLYKGLTVCRELDKNNENIKGRLNLYSGKETYFTEE